MTRSASSERHERSFFEPRCQCAWLKRWFDIGASAGALLALSPVLVVLALLVWLDSGRPILFSQWRVGRGFRPFRILKFRTMRAGLGGPQITVAGDGRVTRVGRFLRATKLDELPQLWNVLRAEMSFVGPRPEVPEYVERFRERYGRILTIRPGITDLASVTYRHEEELLGRSGDPLKAYVERVLPAKLDLAEEYLRRQSFLLDAQILVRTFLVTTGLR